MSGTLRAAECVDTRSRLVEVAWLRLGRTISHSAPLGALAALLLVLTMGTATLANDFDTDKWAARQLKCDGFENNRCYRYVDHRRRNKPYLKPQKYVEEPDRYYVKTAHPRKYYHYPQHYRRYADMYYGRPHHHRHDHWNRGRWDRDRWDRDRDHGRWDRDRDRWDRDRDDKWGYRTHDGRYERQCLYLITTKGAEAQTENGALISAKRAWRASVRADFGERYQDLNNAKRGEYRCWRSSTNESALGRAGEWLTGQYRKRCQVWATPCLGERQTLEGDQDDKE
jgi:hypothetical protein